MKKNFLILGLFFFIALPVQAGSLNVPYSSQSPFQDWNEPWQNACEEAVIVMLNNYYDGESLSRQQAHEQILEVFRIKNNYIGFSLDENVETMSYLINNFFKWEVKVVDNPGISQIKNQIDLGQPVIVPVHGRSLGNPHFRHQGPVYHVILVVGYDDVSQEFIVKEPGTIFGDNYRYAYKVLMKAMHDYLPDEQTINGAKRVLFTQKLIQASANYDGDFDQLMKADELKYGTILYFADSDGDGYLDGEEVKAGYSPVKADHIAIFNNVLVKSADRPEIYVIENNLKRHVLNLEALKNSVAKWGTVNIVSEAYLISINNGSELIK